MDQQTAPPETPELSAPEIMSSAAPIAPDAPRKRGRPPGSTNKPRAPGAPLSETPISANPAPGTAPRGRPRKVVQIDAGLMAKQLQGLHLVAARATGLQELEISEAEAAMLAESVAAISREYGLSLDGKTGATIQLVAACAMIYLPRLAHITARRKQAARSSVVSDTAPAHAA